MSQLQYTSADIYSHLIELSKLTFLTVEHKAEFLRISPKAYSFISAYNHASYFDPCVITQWQYADTITELLPLVAMHHKTNPLDLYLFNIADLSRETVMVSYTVTDENTLHIHKLNLNLREGY
jgi:hypothetical protein